MEICWCQSKWIFKFFFVENSRKSLDSSDCLIKRFGQIWGSLGCIHLCSHKHIWFFGNFYWKGAPKRVGGSAPNASSSLFLFPNSYPRSALLGRHILAMLEARNNKSFVASNRPQPKSPSPFFLSKFFALEEWTTRFGFWSHIVFHDLLSCCVHTVYYTDHSSR